MRSDRLERWQWAALVAVLAVLPACYDPATGQCQGAIGTTPLDVPIDGASNFHRIWRSSCDAMERTAFDWSYGEGALRIRAETVQAVSLFEGERTYAIPPLPGATFFRSWVVQRPARGPELSAGSVRLSYSADGRVRGSFEMTHADGTALSCEFDLPAGVDEGAPNQCPPPEEEPDDYYGDEDEWDDDWWDDPWYDDED